MANVAGIGRNRDEVGRKMRISFNPRSRPKLRVEKWFSPDGAKYLDEIITSFILNKKLQYFIK